MQMYGHLFDVGDNNIASGAGSNVTYIMSALPRITQRRSSAVDANRDSGTLCDLKKLNCLHEFCVTDNPVQLSTDSI